MYQIISRKVRSGEVKTKEKSHCTPAAGGWFWKSSPAAESPQTRGPTLCGVQQPTTWCRHRDDCRTGSSTLQLDRL